MMNVNYELKPIEMLVVVGSGSCDGGNDCSDGNEDGSNDVIVVVKVSIIVLWFCPSNRGVIYNGGIVGDYKYVFYV